MKRRFVRLVLVLGLGCSGMMVSGCETWNGFTRRGSTTEPTPVAVDDGDGAEAKGPSGPKGFFKSTRLPGAMSSEGAEIERSLGVQ